MATELESLNADIAALREREAAMREILQVIGASRSDPAPVFDTILKSAAHLSSAPLANLCLLDETRSQWALVAHHGNGLRHLTVGQTTRLADSKLVPAESMRSGAAVHVEDLVDTDLYRQGDPGRVAMVEEEGMRTILGVPLLRDEEAIGCITLFRREVKPFTEDDVELLETFAAQAVIAIENVRQFHEVQTRLEREKASAEILELISRSREDEEPVFDLILKRATNLCDAFAAGLVLGTESDPHQRLAASQDVDPRTVAIYDRGEVSMDPNISFAARAIVECTPVHIVDMAETDGYRNDVPIYKTVVDDSGIRTNLFVPLVTKTGGIGALILFRKEVRPYTDDEIELVKSFAAQAVIAIENVRQFREVQERLEREKASAQVLEVISQSREDEQPVLDAIVRHAAQLTDAHMVGISLVNAARTHLSYAAVSGAQTEYFPKGTEFELSGPLQVAVTVREARTIHTPDLKKDPLYEQGDPVRLKIVDDVGIRSFLTVPLVHEGTAFGCLNLNRKNVRPFTDDEIQMIETFAAQAVIAIENVRQFRALQEQLERETSSAEVLDIISRSREDDLPVFEKITQSVVRLCNASLGYITVLNRARTHVTIPAQFGARPEFAERLSRFNVSVEDDWIMAVDAALNCRVIRIEDLAEDPLYKSGNEYRVNMVDEEGMRSVLVVPLVSGDTGLGCVFLYRREVRAFSDVELDLVRAFAAQAVIAIENVRQFREVQERLEREKASKDILGVISLSRDDETPVFEEILESAARLCRAPMAWLLLLNADRSALQLAAYHGPSRRALKIGQTWPMTSERQLSGLGQALLNALTVQDEDLTQAPGYLDGDPDMVQLVDEEGLRTRVSVPLVSNGQSIGAIVLSRREVSRFSEDDIRLADTFAGQAVIAIENVRQFREVQERLEREAATTEVLNVISQSRSDARPVFRTILENAAHLCGAPHAMLLLRDAEDEHLVLAANNAAHSMFIDQIKDKPHRLDNTDSYAVRAVLEQRVIHVPDLREATEASKSVPQIKVALELEGMRTVLQVPLLQGDRAIGVIALYTLEVAPFTDDQIKLVETFAAQAVIAIENTKQLQNLEALNAELGDRVEEQVGEIERMGKLKRFLPAAVADTVVMSGSEDMLKSHRALLGVLFCDIRGFTAFCETAEPEETIEVLQTYHEEMGKLINAHGAGVDHRMGDGIMVLFNDPIPCDDPAGDAVRLAVAMRARMAELGKDWKRMGFRLGFGVGVSLGYATVGMVGYEGRSDYTASGTAINVASRLCEMAEDGEVLLSTRAAIAVEDDFASVSTGEVTLKGIREPVEVFSLIEVSEV